MWPLGSWQWWALWIAILGLAAFLVRGDWFPYLGFGFNRNRKIISANVEKDCPALILDYEGKPSRGGVPTEVPFIIRNDGPGTALKVFIREKTDRTQDGGLRTLDFGKPISQIPEGGNYEIKPEVWTKYWDASKGLSQSARRGRLSKYLREKMRVPVTVTYKTNTGKDCRRSFVLIHVLGTGGVRNEPIFDQDTNS